MTTPDASKGDRAALTARRSIAEKLSANNIRVAVVGNVDAGKSTLIGSLVMQNLDDGRGKSRSLIAHHSHELESGRTSTASSSLLGFKADGETITIAGALGSKNHKSKLEEIIGQEAYRIVTLTDLAGHEKYLKTTIHGVSKGFADYALVLVSARQPPMHMTLHHIQLCVTFNIPVIVVLTKTDGCPEHVLKETTKEVGAMLRSPEIGKRPYAVRSENDVETVKDKIASVTPVIYLSCVSGEGLEILRKLLFSVPKRRRHHEKKVYKPLEFLVEDTFNVPGTGPIVSGFVNAGRLSVGDTIFVGPLKSGTFINTTVKSAHLARNLVDEVIAGDDACLSLALSKDQKKMLRQGMVVIREVVEPVGQFDAEVCVLKGEGTTISENYTTFIHILHVRQAGRVTGIEVVDYKNFRTAPFYGYEGGGKVVLRPGCRAKVTFEFLHRPEYVREGMRIIFRDAHVRGVGIVMSVRNETKKGVM